MSALLATNWAGTVVFEARERYAPRTTSQVQDAVCRAAADGGRLRVVGTGHSFNDIADTDGVQLSLLDLERRIDLDEDARCVTIDGGATYAQVNAVLAQRGWALENLASLPHITVAGAIATATHGSGWERPSLASAVRSLTHVTAAGELHTMTRGEPGFEHYPVHLGLFGPVVELILDVVPAFDIATTVYEGLEYDTLVDHLDDLTRPLYSFSIAPDWGDGGRALLFAKRPRGVDAPAQLAGARAATSPRHPSPGADPVAVTEQLGVHGPSAERLTHFRSDFAPSVGDEVQSEYFVSRETVADALRALPRFADVFARLAHSMEIRAVAGDSLSASPFATGEMLAIHLTWRRDPDAVRRELPALEAALGHPRPHWGKLHAAPPQQLSEQFPGLHALDGEARRHDPSGMFRNAWVERLLGNEPA